MILSHLRNPCITLLFLPQLLPPPALQGDEEKAKEHSRRLAELAAAQGCLAAAEGFHFSAGEGAGSVIMWAGARAWGRAYAAAVRAELSPEQLQVCA